MEQRGKEKKNANEEFLNITLVFMLKLALLFKLRPHKALFVALRKN